MSARALPAASLALLLLVAPLAAAAQTPEQPGPDRWSAVRVAKWALLGAAAGFATYAVSHTSRAERLYEGLYAVCQAEPDRCALVDGRYADAAVERRYAQSSDHDRQAQLGIIGAQVALFGSVGLFIYDLRNGRGPRDIPYPSHSARSGGRGLAFGARIGF